MRKRPAVRTRDTAGCLATVLTLIGAPPLFLGLTLIATSFHYDGVDGGRMIGGAFCLIAGLLFAVPAGYGWHGYLRRDE